MKKKLEVAPSGNKSSSLGEIPRKPYKAPELVSYGSLVELTQYGTDPPPLDPIGGSKSST